MRIATRMLIAGSVVTFFASELVPFSPARVGFIGDAKAIIGRPLTPLSYAGVARRTAYRGAVVATSAALAMTAAMETSAAAARAPAPPPASGAGAAAVGTVVGQLPGGCVSAPVGGVEYYLCNGTYYRAAFQGNNLVYVVEKP